MPTIECELPPLDAAAYYKYIYIYTHTQHKKQSSPKRPKGSLFLSPSIKLNLGLSLFSLFQCPVETRILETSA